MKGRKIREEFPEFEITQNLDSEFKGICIDSRKVKEGDLFAAVKGEKHDGHQYIKEAIDNGATGVIVERDVPIPQNILKIKVKDSLEATAIISSYYFGYPSRELKLVGVTGTSGKTTTAFLLFSLFKKLKIKCGYIGTVGYWIGDYFTENTTLGPTTTPEAFQLNEILSKMKEEDVKYVFLEVSSHAIKLKRIYGLKFYDKILTTIGVDHLDFHKTYFDYINAKVSFFANAYKPLLNLDSKEVDRFSYVSLNPIFYSREKITDLYVNNEFVLEDGLLFDLYKNENHLGQIFLKMYGDFNISNFLAVTGFALKEGVSFNEIKNFALDIPIIPGRMELIEGKGLKIFIDFAHNPFEFENVLKYLRRHAKKSLYAVFGVVGGSEYEKCLKMGEIASSYCEYVYVTTDDPRKDDYFRLANNVFSGVKNGKGEIILERRKAIRKCIENAKEGDVIAILGRGDERIVHYKEKEDEFTDISIVREVLNEF